MPREKSRRIPSRTPRRASGVERVTASIILALTVEMSRMSRARDPFFYGKRARGGSVLIVSKYADALSSSLGTRTLEWSLCPVCSSLNYLTSLVTTFPECQPLLPFHAPRFALPAKSALHCSVRHSVYSSLSMNHRRIHSPLSLFTQVCTLLSASFMRSYLICILYPHFILGILHKYEYKFVVLNINSLSANISS